MTAAAAATVSGSDGDPLAGLGGGDGNGTPLAEPLAWATLAVTRRESWPALGAAEATELPAAGCGALTLCGQLQIAKPIIISGIALAVVTVLPAAEGTVANTIGSYGFDIINGLMLQQPNSQVAGYISGLATNSAVLGFVAQTVAGNQALAALPTDVATTIGNTVGYFVQTSFGNPVVALAAVPVLQALNLPTDLADAYAFLAAAKNNVTAAILASGQGVTYRALNAAQMQTALINLFDNAGVQNALGSSVADAVTVLIGATSPSWAAPVNPNAIADYAGQLAAAAVLGADNPNTAALSATIGGALAGLFSAIGGDVASQAGDAFITLLNQSGVDDALATVVVNELVSALGGVVPFPIHDSLAQLLAPGAGVAVNGFVNALLTQPGVPAALEAFLTQLIPGMLANPGVQQELGAGVAATVSTLLGGGAVGQVVGARVGDAVVALVANPVIGDALVGLIDTVLGDILGTAGVVSALANAAGELATAELQGDLAAVLPTVEATLRADTAIQTAVGLAAGDAVTQLLGDTAVLSTVDTAIASLLTALIGDGPVQAGLDTQITAAVAELLGGGPLGQVVGVQVGAAVVALVTDPTVGGALVDLVDTVFGDFFGAAGVVPALADAADQLAGAAVRGDLAAVLPVVGAALRANIDVESAVGVAVGAAVSQFLGDAAVWSAVDGAVSSLLAELIGDPAVQAALDTQVAATVSALLGGGALGQVVGAQVGAAVVAVVTDPVVSDALIGLVDTVFGDFFGAAGVVGALADVSDQLALAVVSGEDLSTALAAALAGLRTNTDIEAAVGLAVGDAVAQLLGDTAVWTAIDTAASSLVTELIGDPEVQQALDSRVAAEVSALLGGGALGQVVGAQVGAAVVELVTDPVVSTALVGLVDTVFGDFFGAAGVVGALADAADQLALAVVGGQDISAALATALAGLRADPDIEAAVGLAVGDAVAALLGDTAVWTAVDTTASSLTLELIGNPEVQAALDARVAAVVSALLGGGALGQVVGAQVGDAVLALVTNPVVSEALVSLAGSVFGDFFGAAGVVTAFADVADQLALALVGGTNPEVAIDTALAALKADAAIAAAVTATIADALNLVNTTVLSNPAIEQALGTMVSTLVTGLATSPVVQTFLADEIGPPFGDVLANLLANTAVVDEVATTFGSAVTQLLAYPGFSTALTDAIGQFADAVLDGTSVSTAWHSALQLFQSTAAVEAAINAVITPDLNTLLAYPVVRQAIGTAAQQVMIAGIGNQFLGAVAGQVAKGTVESFLATGPATNLIDSLVVRVLLGMPLSDLTHVATQDVIHQPLLQIALGMSIGQGIGSLFGDNIVGELIGVAAGVPITVVIGVTAAVVGFLQWVFGEPAGAAESHYFQPLPAAADVYVLEAILVQSGKSIGTRSAVRIPAIAS